MLMDQQESLNRKFNYKIKKCIKEYKLIYIPQLLKKPLIKYNTFFN